VMFGARTDGGGAAGDDGGRYQHGRGEARLDEVRAAALATPLESCVRFAAAELQRDAYLAQYNLRPTDVCPTCAEGQLGSQKERVDAQCALYAWYTRGFFRTAKYKVVAQVFQPTAERVAQSTSTRGSSIRTVLVLHGYNDHIGALQDTVKHLLTRGRRVVAFDLPGHGLSSGKQNVVHDFGDYADAVAAVRPAVHKLLARVGESDCEDTWDCVAHSTGASAVIEHMHRMQQQQKLVVGGDSRQMSLESKAMRVVDTYDDGFDRVVMFAPLVRFVKWNLSKFGRMFHSCILRDYVTARAPERRVDERFRYWEQLDALQSPRVELEWVRAVYSWEHRVRTYDTIPRPVLLVQGTRDNTVLWRHNIPLLCNQVFANPRAELEIIEGATHQFLNTSDALQRRLFTLIDMYIIN